MSCVVFYAVVLAEFQVDDVYRRMRRDGWPVGAIHGDKTQPERDQVLNGWSRISFLPFEKFIQFIYLS